MGYYVSNLGTTLISIKQQITYKGCYFHAEENSCILAFPGCIIQENIDNEITLLITPATNLSQSYAFDQDTSKLCKCNTHAFNVVNPALARLRHEHIKPTDITQVSLTKLSLVSSSIHIHLQDLLIFSSKIPTT